MEELFKYAEKEYIISEKLAGEFADRFRESFSNKEYSLEELNACRTMIVQQLNTVVNFELCKATVSKVKL